VKFVIEGELAT